MNKEIVNKDDTTLIELVDVTKAFGEQVVLKGLNLKINSNEFVTLLGPSGCGKTTTLRIIGGFVEPSSGQVLFNGKDINEMPAHKRPSNTVFQRYSLFPHLDVFEMLFGLRVKSREFQAQYKIERLVEEYDNMKMKKIQLRRKNLKKKWKKKFN